VERKKRVKALSDNPALAQDLPERLVELDVELRRHSARKVADRALSSITAVAESAIGDTKVIRFTLTQKAYAVGFIDLMHGQANHARGIRHIRFYENETMVLEIEGDIDKQELGSNFRFKNIDTYVPGPWEAVFIKLTDRMRHLAGERRIAFRQKRVAEQTRRH
jgi:hypothetical protein